MGYQQDHSAYKGKINELMMCLCDVESIAQGTSINT